MVGCDIRRYLYCSHAQTARFNTYALLLFRILHSVCVPVFVRVACIVWGCFVARDVMVQCGLVH